MIVEAVDNADGRNVARFIFDKVRGHVYIETVGNHDGVVVATKVRVDRSRFSEMMRALGAI